MDLFSVCPQLVPQCKTRAEFRGFISVNKKDYYLSVSKPEELKDALIECEWSLQHLLRGYETLIQQRLQQSESLPSFLQELKTIAEKADLNTNKPDAASSSPEFYENLIRDAQSLGWNRIIQIDDSFRELQVSVVDEAKREHVMKINLHKNHPLVAPRCTSDLPAAFDPRWSSHERSICDLYYQLEQQVALYQRFWDMMDEIDCKTWVVEPEKPTRSATHRRIALGTGSSLQIEVNPLNPTLFPECRFLGPDHVIQPLQELMSKNAHKWNTASSVLTNLRLVLDTEFPSPSSTSKEDFSMECGICYSYRLEDEIPDKTCEDRRCGQPFHHTCLYQWLRALPTARQSFNTIFGECPYCEMPITVKMPVAKMAE